MYRSPAKRDFFINSGPYWMILGLFRLIFHYFFTKINLNLLWLSLLNIKDPVQQERVFHHINVPSHSNLLSWSPF
jgi:hypothetical protein